MRSDRLLHGRLVRVLAMAGAAVCLSSGPARAAPLAYEGFGGPGYAAGASLNGLAGGTGWSGGWAAGNPQAFIATAGLSFGALATQAGAATATAKSSSPSGDEITFEGRDAAQLFGADGSTLYLSFLLRPEAGSGFYGGLNLGDLFIGKSGTTVTYGLETGAGIASSTVAAALGETVLLVVRAQFLAGDDLFDLYVNPQLGSAEPLAADATLTGFDLGSTSRLVINNAGAWTIDEIRLGGRFADVTPTAVPEPPLTALLATGLVVGWLRRRRALRAG